MKEFLDQNCKFQIGQIVTLKAQVAALKLVARKDDAGTPQLMQVVERLVQECYGGVQVNYAVRITEGDGSMLRVKAGTIKELFSFTEPELVEFTEANK